MKTSGMLPSLSAFSAPDAMENFPVSLRRQPVRPAAAGCGGQHSTVSVCETSEHAEHAPKQRGAAANAANATNLAHIRCEAHKERQAWTWAVFAGRTESTLACASASSIVIV